jgi:probable phosphoglycerate mutase
MNKKPIMYFVRHGTTAGNAADTFRGGIDYPLNKEGKQDAKNLGTWFDKKQISEVYASPKQRTRDTADAIATPKGLKVNIEPNLFAINVGYLAGEPKKNHEGVMSYFEKNPDEKIPMGESLTDFRARTQPPIKKLLVKASQAAHPLVAVVHSSVIHELNHIISGDHNQTLVKPGGVVGVFRHPTKGLALKALYRPEVESPGMSYHG